MIDEALERKISRLDELVRQARSLAVAFSAGVDSTLLLKVATDRLGDRAVGFMGVSPSVPPGEVDEARDLAARMGARLELIEPAEMADPRYRRNDSERCYWCKSALFAAMREAIHDRGIAWLADGLHFEDEADVRPGRRAADERGVRHPLMEAGYTKRDVRAHARRLGLPNWNKPAMACLASRVPFGTTIDAAILEKVGRAERQIKDLGLPSVRVRHHGPVARIEVPAEDLLRALAAREAISRGVKSAGYVYVALDIDGYRYGSAHENIGGGERGGN